MSRRLDPAEPVPLVPADPLPLVRAPSLRESWFDSHHEPSVSSSAEIDVRDSTSPSAAPTNSSALCGAFIGLVAAAAMIMTAMTLSHADVARAFGRALTKESIGGDSALGIFVLMVWGMVIGAGFARATIHVRRMLPVAIFGIVFLPIAWLALHVFVLERFGPRVAQALPVGGMVAGAAVAGLVLSFVVPLRGGERRARRVQRVSIV